VNKYTPLAAALLLAGAIGCGPAETQLDMTEYDRFCELDRDCALAIEGDVCACSCDSAAINRKSIDRYRADYSAALDACSEETVCGACEQVTEAYCDDGVCAARVVE
jgi:hypothetical protein